MLTIFGLILLGSATLCSALLCWLVRGAARHFNFVDEPGERKIHSKPIALGGGIAFFLTVTAIVAGCVIFGFCQARNGISPWLPQLVKNHVPRLAGQAWLALYVLAGGAVMFMLGLLDDLWLLRPSCKLAVQALVAAALWTVSSRLRLTAFVGLNSISFVYTVLWIVGITNTFNLLDNMDGLSAGVAAIASLVFIVVAAMTQQYFLAAVLLVFAGSLLGFLVFNFPPATLFMGDAGSMFIGYILATLTILFTFYMPGQGASPIPALLIPLVILAVPIYDTVSVVIIRMAAGKPIFAGDKNHFSHRLVALGMGHRAAVLTIYLVTLCTGLLAPLLLRLASASLLVMANVVVMLLLIWLLEHAGRTGRQNSRNSQGNSP